MKHLFVSFSLSALILSSFGLSASAQMTTDSPTNTNQFGSGTTPPVGSSPTSSTYPGSTTSTSFPSFPQSPAQALLPSWSVGSNGSSSYSGSFGNSGQYGGGSYSGSSNYGNSFSGSGYNFPNQQGVCGFSAYLDAIGAQASAVSKSTPADVGVDAVAGRVGVSFSSQKCINYLKIEEIRSKTEIGKVSAAEKEVSRRRCIEATAELGRSGSTNPTTTELAMKNIMTLCTGLLEPPSQIGK